MARSDEINELIGQPRESLAVEVKDWLDPSIPGHKAKVVKALIALRNFNGGYLLIGFDNATMQPSKNLLRLICGTAKMCSFAHMTCTFDR